jgi:hypothetical protein
MRLQLFRFRFGDNRYDFGIRINFGISGRVESTEAMPIGGIKGATSILLVSGNS